MSLGGEAVADDAAPAAGVAAVCENAGAAKRRAHEIARGQAVLMVAPRVVERRKVFALSLAHIIKMYYVVTEPVIAARVQT